MSKSATVKNVFQDDQTRVTVPATFTEAALAQLREYYKFEVIANGSDLTEAEYIGHAASGQVYKWMQGTNAAVKLTQDKNVKKIIARDRAGRVKK
jgi:hypothetical protein